jgi:hypothetical protein
MDDPTSLIDNHEFITDCARYAEGLLSEEEVKKKHHFADETWERLGSADALVEAIKAEKTRRIRNGTTARERAQALFAEAPNVLGNIMNDDGASPRHRIESARELRQIAGTGSESTLAESERFIITINLGTEVIHFDKPLAPDKPRAIEINPNDTDSTP